MYASCYDCKNYESGLMWCTYYNIACSDLSKRWWHGIDDAKECSGFRNKYPGSSSSSGSSGCFLTSACVEFMGKSDDCEELTVLRSFRDGYMKSVDGGDGLIKEYYAVAPKIVERINASDKKSIYYTYISEVVEKCVKLISLKENERALSEYKFMVENLKKEFEI